MIAADQAVTLLVGPSGRCAGCRTGAWEPAACAPVGGWTVALQRKGGEQQ